MRNFAILYIGFEQKIKKNDMEFAKFQGAKMFT